MLSSDPACTSSCPPFNIRASHVCSCLALGRTVPHEAKVPLFQTVSIAAFFRQYRRQRALCRQEGLAVVSCATKGVFTDTPANEGRNARSADDASRRLYQIRQAL